MLLERVSHNASYVCKTQTGCVWTVGVHVIGTAGNLAKFGLAYTDGEEFWDYTECDEYTALHYGESIY